MAIEGELVEKLAEAVHELFCGELRARGYQYGTVTSDRDKRHSSLKPYAELNEDEKEQNRSTVRHITAKLASAGYAIRAKRGNEASPELTEEEIDSFSEMEHGRWMQLKLGDGWRYARKTDKAKKLHRDLVPWSRLSRREQNKDRLLVRAIPKILSQAGLVMVKVAPISDADLPALYRVADRAALAARRKHSALTASNLILMLVAALIGSISFTGLPGRATFTIAAATILGVTVILTLAIRIPGFERIWRSGRAVAESVKSLAWQYMTHSQQFSNIDDAESDRRFALALAQLIEQRKEFCSGTSVDLASEPQIAEYMRRVRRLEVSDRKGVYLSHRINDQIGWYSTKAQLNRKSANMLYAAMVVAQIGAFIAAIFIAAEPESRVNLARFMVTLAMAILTWVEYQRYQELAESYAVTEQELRAIAALEKHVDTDRQLSSFVSDCERTIAKEHTVWLARRDYA